MECDYKYFRHVVDIVLVCLLTCCYGNQIIMPTGNTLRVTLCVCVCRSRWDWALRSGGKEEGGVDRGVDQQPFRADISPEWKHDRDKDKPRKWRLTTVKADGAGAGGRGPSQREAVTLLLQWPVRPAAPPCWSLSPLDLVTAALLCCLGSREW